MKKISIFISLLIVFSFAIGKEAIYKVYYGFLPIGEIKFKWEEKQLYIKGNVYSYLKFVYDYNFEFLAKDNDFYLYEKENDKTKTFKKEEIFKKKPWLPLLVQFLQTKKADEKGKYPYKLEKEGNKYIIYPLSSKKVSKIVIVFDEDKQFPKKIKIYGKYFLKLERKNIIDK
ncbi:MAG: hypothetical protein GXO21_01405 [Aquificae bacterium]|nr:hypothetical protein [Aquificota bacterium]